MVYTKPCVSQARLYYHGSSRWQITSESPAATAVSTLPASVTTERFTATLQSKKQDRANTFLQADGEGVVPHSRTLTNERSTTETRLRAPAPVVLVKKGVRVPCGFTEYGRT